MNNGGSGSGNDVDLVETLAREPLAREPLSRMMTSQGIGLQTGWPFEERAALMHWMAERRSEKESRHLSHVMV